MTSDVDRREIAKALRGDPDDTLIPQVRDGFEWMTYNEAAYRFWDMCRRVESAADIDIAHSTTTVLADLIDPTCEVVGTAVSCIPHGPEIFRHELSCGHTCAAFWPDPPAHCCECGARVVTDDDAR